MTSVLSEPRPRVVPARTSRGGRSSRRATRLTGQLVVLAGALVLWQVIGAADLVGDQAFAGPADTAGALLDLARSGGFWTEVGQTLSGWSIGLGVAVLVAVPLGILLGTSDSAYRSSRFLIDFMRTIPVLGIIPLATLVYGSSRSAELFLVIPACTWPLLLQTIYGVRDVDPVALETARSFRLGRARTLTRVVLPSATPFVATGLRIAAVIGMLVAISIELLVRVPGVGNGLARAQGSGATDGVYAYTLTAALLGLAVVLVFGQLEKRLIHWHQSQRTTS
ncbi:ABC-type nitrate/sulfonate/bicarbonate transport system permease component [Nocardioides zeae]|uniref:ABC-type nitrate/sulfonate/bicarbonate transport system permease component n=2 Tax=Nocardioides zeae TaxID=1457234 RepID=A0AAJ1U952_9ACTN|nr:ABC transporter permease [Nocardioides zeae]MDQ1106676.1 ABC-type nitrate/sulfonate/bicarbonate transport system permease component [Nocardioides zeae]MDR6173661.1 ABC-type nitrate/sulfonate/bicarbonate transport system permease component [Nocardioides zeae]MDR6211066.1 ABC-type nitrate/sulfonate/bicarbonate transport system permease component [Nocardioides zeae]